MERPSKWLVLLSCLAQSALPPPHSLPHQIKQQCLPRDEETGEGGGDGDRSRSRRLIAACVDELDGLGSE